MEGTQTKFSEDEYLITERGCVGNVKIIGNI